MQANDLSRDTLRRLAEAKSSGGGKALSFYLNLEPSEFATPPARASAIRSLLDEGERKVKAHENGGGDKRLRQDFARAREVFGGELPTEGARGLAVFVAEDTLDVIPLSRPVRSEVVISDSPFIEPLVDLISGSWCIVLSSRRSARFFRGSSDRLEQVASISSDDVLPQVDTGGLSHDQHERPDAEDVHKFQKRVGELVHRRFRRAPFDHLLIGSPEELASEVERAMHPDVHRRFVGRISVDVDHTTEGQVLEAALPSMHAVEVEAERAALDRLKQGVGAGGRGVSGLDETLASLNERRVETLLIEERFQMPGTKCGQCGSIYADNIKSCPADEATTEPYDDIVEEAVELALAQAANVTITRHHDDLEQMGGIGAVLRF